MKLEIECESRDDLDVTLLEIEGFKSNHITVDKKTDTSVVLNIALEQEPALRLVDSLMSHFEKVEGINDLVVDKQITIF